MSKRLDFRDQPAFSEGACEALAQQATPVLQAERVQQQRLDFFHLSQHRAAASRKIVRHLFEESGIQPCIIEVTDSPDQTQRDGFHCRGKRPIQQ